MAPIAQLDATTEHSHEEWQQQNCFRQTIDARISTIFRNDFV